MLRFRGIKLLALGAMAIAPLSQASLLETFTNPGFDNNFTTTSFPFGHEGNVDFSAIGGVGVLQSDTIAGGSDFAAAVAAFGPTSPQAAAAALSAPHGPLAAIASDLTRLFGNQTVEAQINVNNDSRRDHGLVARASGLGGYVFGVDAESTLDRLYLGFINGDPATPTVLASVDLRPLSLAGTDTYTLRFHLEGTNLVGLLLDETGGTELARLEATDDTFAFGAAGLVATIDSPFDFLRASFDNFSVVPAPASIALLIAGFVLLGRRRKV